MKSLIRAIPFEILFEVESVKKIPNIIITPIFIPKVFGTPKRSLASSPRTGVPIPTVVIIAMK